MSEKQGTIVQVMGPVVDVAFDGGALPEVKEALEVELDGRREVMEVAQHVGGDTVRLSKKRWSISGEWWRISEMVASILLK